MARTRVRANFAVVARWLTWFVSVDESGRLGICAARRGISSARLSRAIDRLRNGVASKTKEAIKLKRRENEIAAKKI